MRFKVTTATLFVLAAAEPGRSFISPSDIILGARDVLSLPYLSSTTATPGGGSPLVRRQTASDSLQLGPGDGANSSAWDRETDAACVEALRAIERSTNPSGNCLCYNLPSLDTKTGIFNADLRLYRISEPREGFIDVPPSKIKVGVQYNGASVSLATPKDMQAMGMTGSANSSAPPAVLRREEAKGPQQLQKYMFVGQIDKDRMADAMSMATLEALVMPTFTLTAQDTKGGAVSTNVSLNEAAFLNGVFSKQVVRSDFASAQAAVDAKLAAVRNGTVAFVLPGVQLMVFPIGLIITSVWLLLGLTAYGIGTYERTMYAHTYKRRLGIPLGGVRKGF
ncbi:hypothetical protein CDD83_2425 [Cordyceps sp. RAO-2017]|nr:hypothetical protein CDD83_2425 [Cordyceps sp. RAO-2017]